MAGYSIFAQFYDRLTANINYSRQADYLMELMGRLGHTPGLTLDLACGTGSLTLELFRRGVDVYGVDASVEMLSLAREKCADAEADILFLRQNMQELDLYGTVHTVVCSLDSVNHLQGKTAVQQGFQRVSLFLEPDGYFLFDLNTLYKHENVLGNHTFVYDMEDVYCVWQNRCGFGTGRVDIRLDFFSREEKLYRRSGESFSEYAYPLEAVTEWLQKAGFEDVQIFHELSFDPPRPESARVVFAAKKKGSGMGNGPYYPHDYQ